MSDANLRLVRRATVAIALTLVSPATVARADGNTSAVAQSLFQEARALLGQQRYAEACPKFAESFRLDAAGGTLVNLAICYEKQGKTATAWATFQDAAAQAKREGRADREKFCLERVRVLEPELSRLTIHIAQPLAAGYDVRLDGSSLGRATWGSPVPVDPGVHELTVKADAHESATITIEVGARRAHVDVDVPKLTPSPSVAAGDPSPPARDAAQRKSPALGYGLILGGAAAAAVGAGFGVDAVSKANAGDETGFQTSAWVANVGIGVGLIAAAVGTYLVVSSKSSSEPRALAPNATRGLCFGAYVAADGARASLGGAF